MKFIVGLGNPGKEYENTRHNLGRLVVARFAELQGLTFKRDKYASALKAQTLSDVVVALPETFMNRSGQAVRLLLDSKPVSVHDLCVVLDDVETPWGIVRMKYTGGTSGHNGLKSIHKELGVSSYAQLRVGIGRPEGMQPVADYVLDRFSGHELEKLPTVIEQACGVLESWCKGEISSLSQGVK